MDVPEKDWKIFSERLPKWQEEYMDKLCCEYVSILSDTSKEASERFWTIEKMVNLDKQTSGVLLKRRRSTFYLEILNLLDCGAIKEDDISDFSEETQKIINEFR